MGLRSSLAAELRTLLLPTLASARISRTPLATLVPLDDPACPLKIRPMTTLPTHGDTDVTWQRSSTTRVANSIMTNLCSAGSCVDHYFLAVTKNYAVSGDITTYSIFKNYVANKDGLFFF